MAEKDVALEVLENIIESGSEAEAQIGSGQVVSSVETTGSAPTHSVEVEEADPHRVGMEELGTYDGTRVSSDVIFANEGHSHSQTRRANDLRYQIKLAEAARFYGEMVREEKSMRDLEEAMVSSEFTSLLGDTLDRVLLAQYATYQPSYRRFLKTRNVRDFRSVGSVRRHGGKGLALVNEGETYPQAGLEESAYSFAVKKYGMTYMLSWEAFVNDDLGAFTSLPANMAEDAVQEEMSYASSLYVNNSTLFSTTHSVDGTNYSNKDTAALSIVALKAAWNNMLKYPGDGKHDGTRRPLNNQPVFLVVPPALALEAVEILGTMQVQWAGGDASASAVAVAQPTRNALAGMLTVLVDPYIPILDATNGHTSWYLFSPPSGRLHAAEIGFLSGYSSPQLFQKRPNAMAIGGGNADSDFDTDAIGYKIRHVFGGTHANAVGNWRGCYWSDGTV